MDKLKEYLERYYTGDAVDPTISVQHGDDIIQITITKKHQDESNFDEWIETCPYCQRKTSLRKVFFCSTLVSAMTKGYERCKKHSTNVCPVWEIELNPKEYARMNDLVRFGIAFKTQEMKAGQYGLNLTRICDFLHWQWTVAEYFLTDPTKKNWDPQKRIMSESRITINQVKGIDQISKETDGKNAEYFKNPFISNK